MVNPFELLRVVKKNLLLMILLLLFSVGFLFQFSYSSCHIAVLSTVLFVVDVVVVVLLPSITIDYYL